MVTTLRIIIPEELIMDGIVGIPQVGDSVDYTLQFYEAQPWINPEASNDVVALVEPLNEGRLSAEWTDPNGHVHPGTYSMMVHGDGWRAYFLSTRLYEGTAQLVGSFEADWPGVLPSEAQVAGTVARCQLITRTNSTDAEGRSTEGWADTLGPVPEGQTGFRIPSQDCPTPRVREIGILVDLAVTTSQ
ncbi:hypothetical protein ROP_pROB01-05430 (plasmid) [Rhodococcus opacus B4]|uniref:Uncharacterized protein n=1 Tax=Rhodococcus opacus (strain B4) TaxID=632772 RepID=C1BCI7_RHOOB|nr:hypothetical protein ROP_pROB01-05430 [Rhodococcus opacus B4]